MNTPSQAPRTDLGHFPESNEIPPTRTDHSAVTASPIRSPTRNEIFTFQGQILPTVSHLYAWGWLRHFSILVAHFILRWTSRAVPRFGSSSDPPLRTATRTATLVTSIQVFILMAAFVVPFAVAYPACQAAECLAPATKLKQRWTLSFCTPMVRRRVSDAWAVVLVVACARMVSAGNPPELRVLDPSHAALLGVVGRAYLFGRAELDLQIGSDV